MTEICSPQGPSLVGSRYAPLSVRLSFLVFFLASFFVEKIKDRYNGVRSAALEVVANNWKSIYSAEICCFQIFHRFATKYLKAYTMLRWIALRFVAAPHKGTALDRGFSIRRLIRDRSFFVHKIRKVWTMLRSGASTFFIAWHQNVGKSKQCWDDLLPSFSLLRAKI